MKNLKYWVEKSCETCGKPFWSLIKRNGRFCSNTCSSSATAQDTARLNKIKQTKLERYGSASYVNPEKAKQTNLKKYGVTNPSKSEVIKKKIKQSTFKKYGVEYNWQAKEVQKKIKQTNLKRYGVENPSSSEFVKEKRATTNVKNYGVENVFQSEVIKEQAKQTMLDNHGTEFYSQTDAAKQAQRKRVFTRFMDNLANHKLNVNYIPLFTKADYVTTDRTHRYKFKCKTCGAEFLDHLAGGHLPRCLVCFPCEPHSSMLERALADFIKTLIPGVEVIEGDRSILGQQELDIYIPSLNLAIEFNGLYWHSEFVGKGRWYHLEKTTRCLEKGIRLIHIFEDEWVNQNELVKNKFKYILQQSSDKVYARKCTINIVGTEDCNLFLANHHIQGPLSAYKHALGLYYDNNLVSVMVFGKPRVALGNSKSAAGEFELYRYATSTSVVGGASRLLSYFIKHYEPSNIISYADKRWSTENNNLYTKLGFIKVNDGTPNYWYFKFGYSKRYHRFNFRKDKLAKKLESFSPDFTEWQNMQMNGYDRIWDCGSIKYEMEI